MGRFINIRGAVVVAAAIIVLVVSLVRLGHGAVGIPRAGSTSSGSGENLPADGNDPTRLLRLLGSQASPTAAPSISGTATQPVAAPTGSPPRPTSPAPAHSLTPSTSGGSTASSASAARPSQSPTPSQQQLTQALLTVSQLPPYGFVQQQSSASGSEAAQLTGCSALNSLQAAATAVVSTAFSAGQLGPDLTEILVQYEDVAGASQTIAGFGEVPALCGLVTATVDGLPLQITISDEAFPAIGDGSAALGLHIAVVGTAASVDAQLVAVRHGATVIALSNLGIPLDTSLTLQAVETAYQNVTSRW